jgi:excisionase family DNA binding protein
MQMNTLPPLLITVEETMQQLRIGRSKLYSLVKKEGLSVHKFGRRTLIDPEELRSWLVLRRQQGHQ